MLDGIRTFGIHLAANALLFATALSAQEIEVIPLVKGYEPGNGRLVLSVDCPIVAKDASLQPLAEVAQENLELLFDAKSHVARGDTGSGGIEFRIDEHMEAEAYELKVSDRVVVSGGSYQGVVWGMMTLLQAADWENSKLVIPRMKITDRPFAAYRGLLIDLARQWHPIETVKQAVVLCEWYKIGCLQLHFTDDQSWTFPSKAYPALATPGRKYTRAELDDLESFAHARGVTIVPELDVPGHSRALVGALGDEVGNLPRTADSSTICAGRESTYQTLDTLIGEVCDVFKSTPYFHIGCDEVDKSAWKQCKNCIDYRKRYDIENEEELYRHFINRMNGIVKKHGKRTIVWEGFKVAGKISVSGDILVMEFESLYELPQNYAAAGYTVINTAWQPLYLVPSRNWTPEKILSWNMYRWEHWLQQSAAYPKGIDVPETASILGAQMCSWEQPAKDEIPTLRQRLAAMSERVWDHKTKRTFADFSARLKSTDARLSKLLEGVPATEEKGPGG